VVPAWPLTTPLGGDGRSWPALRIQCQRHGFDRLSLNIMFCLSVQMRGLRCWLFSAAETRHASLATQLPKEIEGRVTGNPAGRVRRRLVRVPPTIRAERPAFVRDAATQGGAEARFLARVNLPIEGSVVTGLSPKLLPDHEVAARLCRAPVLRP